MRFLAIFCGTIVAATIASLCLTIVFMLAGGYAAIAVLIAICGIVAKCLDRFLAADCPEPVEAYAAPEGLNVVKLEARR